jgi:hypothetical protein
MFLKLLYINNSIFSGTSNPSDPAQYVYSSLKIHRKKYQKKKKIQPIVRLQYSKIDSSQNTHSIEQFDVLIGFINDVIDITINY